MMPNLERKLCFITPWCTNAQAKSMGMGAMSLLMPRSESMMMFAPSSTSFTTLFNRSSSARSSPLFPSLATYSALTDLDLKSSCSINLILSRSSLEMMGFWMFSFFACAGMTSKIFASLPTDMEVSVTISSRIPSSGGLVTCANNCLK